VELVSWELKKKIGQFAYIVAGARALRELKPVLQVSDGRRRATGELVLIGNGRLYGGPIPVFEQADLRDGLVDVVVFPKVNWFVILRYACAYLSARLLRRGREECFQAAQLTVEGTTPAPVELDGEHVGHLPATCVVSPQRLKVVVGG
jgi:diacylglycerol kinase family enzyme